MSEGSGQPLRFCTSCGAKARAGTSFCVSCGASLVQNPEAPTSAHDAVSSEGEPKAEDGSLQGHRAPQDQDGGSPQSIYDEYAFHRRFFQEARDGLIRFSGRLKQGEDEGVNEQLTHNDLAGPLLYARMGLDKVEEYKETLTAPMLSSEFSLQEAWSMLTELQKIQGEVLTSLEDFWDRLEAQEGYAHFKDEFARWYTESLESHASAEPNRSQRRSAPDLSEPPPRGQQGPTASPEAVTPSELANRAINWFRDLPSVPKLIIVGLALLVLLVIFSPVAQVVAVIIFVVSAALLVIRAIQRGPVKGWGIAAVSSFILIFVFGGISGDIYGGLPGSNGPETNGDSGLVGSSNEEIPASESGRYEQDLVVPKDVVENWSSQVPSDLYILVPLYLPFEADSFEETFGEEPYPTYNIGSGLVITVQDAFLMTGIEPDGTVAIDGRTYYYEGSSMCSLRLWEPEGRQPAFSVVWYGTICASQPEEAASMLKSMIRVEGTGGENW